MPPCVYQVPLIRLKAFFSCAFVAACTLYVVDGTAVRQSARAHTAISNLMSLFFDFFISPLRKSVFNRYLKLILLCSILPTISSTQQFIFHFWGSDRYDFTQI